MQYEALAIVWLFYIFFGCISSYIGITAIALKKANELPAKEYDQSIVIETTEESLPYDFANIIYSKLWFQTFDQTPKTGWSYSEHDSIWHLNKYLGAAVKHGFTIPMKDCITLWRNMIKQAKPQSPTRRVYYEHISIAKPFWHYDKDFHIVMHDRKPGYPSYAGNGFGNFQPQTNEHTKPLCGDDWLKEHVAKYPHGELPEQTMTRGKVTA